jgi:hypothetical protein
LQSWYDFENQREEEVLRQWCVDEEIELETKGDGWEVRLPLLSSDLCLRSTDMWWMGSAGRPWRGLIVSMKNSL